MNKIDSETLRSLLCRVGFVYTGEVIAPDGRILQRQVDCNLIPQVGINHLAGLLRGTGSLISNWYCGIYEGDYVPTSATTSADLQTRAQECQAYSQANRPVWANTYDGVQLITNLASRAEFTMNADKTLHGAFLVSASGKGTGTGTLQSIARFSSPYIVPNGSTFRLGISISLVPAS